jgi:type II restriction enzyme
MESILKNISEILGMNPDMAFEYFRSTIRGSIRTWDYFVNWKKVIGSIKPIERELNLLNSLIGKEDLHSEAISLFQNYPSCVKALPALIAVRENSLKVLVDVTNFVYEEFDFSQNLLACNNYEKFAHFLEESGIADLIRDRKVKNLVDYVLGVEVGLDTNGRKNRGGSLMESIVEVFIARDCAEKNALYISQADASSIQRKWNRQIDIGKSSRIIDYVVKHKNKLVFIETNFYGGGGSKLKATATEYIRMSEYWNRQDIIFVWITDGAGWYSTLKPLREYFDHADYLMNLKMLKDGCLAEILDNLS